MASKRKRKFVNKRRDDTLPVVSSEPSAPPETQGPSGLRFIDNEVSFIPNPRPGSAAIGIGPGGVIRRGAISHNRVRGGPLLNNQGTIEDTPVVENDVDLGPDPKPKP